MKLHGTLASPYVRKTAVTVIEAGLDDEVEKITPLDSVWVGDGDAGVVDENPLGKVPVLIARDGSTPQSGRHYPRRRSWVSGAAAERSKLAGRPS
jgi:glutathione S-transferase